MTSSAARRQTEEEIRMGQQRLSEANAAMEDLFRAVSKEFESQKLPKLPRNLVDLAQRLSNAFPYLRISIVFEGGYQSIRAVPVSRQLKEEEVRQAGAGLKELGKTWPTLNEYQAFVSGYMSGIPEDYETLKEENRSMRARLERSRDYPMMMCGPPFGRW